MTIKENERLAVVETKVEALAETMDAMDSKVDLLVDFMVTERARRAGSVSVWASQKALLLVSVSAIGAVISTLSFLLKLG